MSQFKSPMSYSHFARRVRRRSRFSRSADDEAFLEEVVRTARMRIRDVPAGLELWRAQLGHDWKPAYEGDQCRGTLPDPYPPKRMKPVPEHAAGGRANPRGIPVLYLSTHKETAMSEVRPWPGSLISCALFHIVRPLKIVDFSLFSDRAPTAIFCGPDPSEREEAVWTDIDRAFSKPMVHGDASTTYVPTQLLAELFRERGYDGIAYKSVFGSDCYNIALFDLADAELTSCHIFEAESLEFQFEEYGVNYSYWIDEKGARKSMQLEVVGPAPSSNDASSGAAARNGPHAVLGAF